MKNVTRPPAAQRTVVALGSFDGVHLGHQAIIRHTISLARSLNAIPAATTSDPLPAQLLNPDFTCVLTPLRQRIRILTELGIELIQVLPFTTALARLSPSAYLRRYIISPLNPAAVVIGHDHRFGHRRQGDATLLARLLARADIALNVVPEFVLEGVPVRATSIRESLLLGAVAQAARLLGRWYRIEGPVVPGTGTGRRLGFPTLNCRPLERETLVPADGVYACRCDVTGWPRLPAVVNIGHRPTFGGECRTIEAHLFDCEIPDRIGWLTLSFVERIRSERRFDSPTALAAQIAADIAVARRVLERTPEFLGV